MRKVKKYKQYSKNKELSVNIPSRILKFNRPKWKIFQKKLEHLNKPVGSFINPLVRKASDKYWDKSTDYFKVGIQLKRYLINSFDASTKTSFFKKSVGRKKTVKSLLLSFLVKPVYKIDILLSRLYLFYSLYQTRQFIKYGIVRVNNKKVDINYILKKGDIISFHFKPYHKHLKFKEISTKFLNNSVIYSFIEVDLYANNLIILKDINELTQRDLNLIINDYFDLYKVINYKKIK